MDSISHTGSSNNISNTYFPNSNEDIKSKIDQLENNLLKHFVPLDDENDEIGFDCPNHNANIVYVGDDSKTSIRILPKKICKEGKVSQFTMTIIAKDDKIASFDINVEDSSKESTNINDGISKESLSGLNLPFITEELISTKLELQKCKQELKYLIKDYAVTLMDSSLPSFATVSDVLVAIHPYLTTDQMLLLMMQIRGRKNKASNIRYSSSEKQLCLELYCSLGSAYDSLLHFFSLPSRIDIEMWLQKLAIKKSSLVKRLFYHTIKRNSH